MATYLVTGGAGFIGSHLVEALLSAGHRVRVLDNCSTGNRDNLPLRAELTVADITQYDAIRSAFHGVDGVFHVAGLPNVQRSMDQPKETHDVNLTGTLHVLEAARAAGVRRVVFASSAAVYGNTPSPQRVGQGEEPLNIYGASKLAVDHFVRERLKAAPVKIVGLRYFNVYGPGEAHKGHMASMITKLAQHMRAGRRPRIFTDGTQKRDHIFVEDVMRANLLALRAPKEASGIYNVGTGRATSFNAIVSALNETLGTALPPDYFENPYAAAYQNHTEADIAETTSRIGFRPHFDVASGIRAYRESGEL